MTNSKVQGVRVVRAQNEKPQDRASNGTGTAYASSVPVQSPSERAATSRFLQKESVPGRIYGAKITERPVYEPPTKDIDDLQKGRISTVQASYTQRETPKTTIATQTDEDFIWDQESQEGEGAEENETTEADGSPARDLARTYATRFLLRNPYVILGIIIVIVVFFIIFVGVSLVLACKEDLIQCGKDMATM